MDTQSTQQKKTQKDIKGAFKDPDEDWHIYALFSPGSKAQGVVPEFYINCVGQWTQCFLESMHNNKESNDKND